VGSGFSDVKRACSPAQSTVCRPSLAFALLALGLAVVAVAILAVAALAVVTVTLAVVMVAVSRAPVALVIVAEGPEAAVERVVGAAEGDALGSSVGSDLAVGSGCEVLQPAIAPTSSAFKHSFSACWRVMFATFGWLFGRAWH
jgi:hypothetical protein